MSNLESFDLNYLLQKGAKVTKECLFIMSMIPSSQFTQCEGPFFSAHEVVKTVRMRRENGPMSSNCWWVSGIYKVEFNGVAYVFDNETRRMIRECSEQEYSLITNKTKT